MDNRDRTLSERVAKLEHGFDTLIAGKDRVIAIKDQALAELGGKYDLLFEAAEQQAQRIAKLEAFVDACDIAESLDEDEYQERRFEVNQRITDARAAINWKPIP
jgi:hypothetical protein